MGSGSLRDNRCTKFEGGIGVQQRSGFKGGYFTATERINAACVIWNELATNTHSPETLTTTVRPPTAEHVRVVEEDPALWCGAARIDNEAEQQKKQDSGSGAASPPPDADAELGRPKRNHPDFSVEGLADFDAGRATKQVDIDAHASFPILADSKETSVNIEVPSGSSTVASRVFPVPGLYYGSLVSVIKSAFADPLS
ncbi:hypothetical protein B0H13DRAFT_1922517 [Mycena leptocephala]|nr:hypothetical protein B0H13DRAFT_1922517 [Mycena leptocephala]